MHRRRFLALTAASGIALGAGRAGFAASSGPAAAAVVVTDIGPATDPAGLFAVLDGFTGNGLWITCGASISPWNSLLMGTSHAFSQAMACQLTWAGTLWGTMTATRSPSATPTD